MLALTRRKKESIMIGDNIEITIIDMGRDQVKIGIDAPKSVPIYRKEIYTEIKEANKEALTSNKKINLDDLL